MVDGSPLPVCCIGVVAYMEVIQLSKKYFESEEDHYCLFEYYFFHGMNIRKTLQHYKIIDSHADSGKIAKLWAFYKCNYREQYNQAKEAYYGELGVSEPSIVSALADIALGIYDAKKDQVNAAKLLLDILDSTSDGRTISKAQKLIVEVVGDSYESE